MIKRLQYLPLILAGLGGLGGLTLSQAALAQSPPLSAYSDYQRSLVNKAMSGKDGAYEVSSLLARCHGIQSEFFYQRSRAVKITMDDVELYEEMTSQALRAGITSMVLIFNYQPRPDDYINNISNTARDEVRPLLSNASGKIGEPMLEKLFECKRIAGVSDYMLSLRDDASSK